MCKKFRRQILNRKQLPCNCHVSIGICMLKKTLFVEFLFPSLLWVHCTSKYFVYKVTVMRLPYTMSRACKPFWILFIHAIVDVKTLKNHQQTAKHILFAMNAGNNELTKWTLKLFIWLNFNWEIEKQILANVTLNCYSNRQTFPWILGELFCILYTV